MVKVLEKVFSRKPKQLDLESYLLKLKERGLSIDGKEMVDPVPIAPPVGYKKQPSMVEIVRDMVRGERLKQAALEAGAETFEESEDFDVGDENAEELRSGYENDFDPPLSEISKAVTEAKAAEAAKAVADVPPPKAGDGPPPPSPPPLPPTK